MDEEIETQRLNNLFKVCSVIHTAWHLDLARDDEGMKKIRHRDTEMLCTGGATTAWSLSVDVQHRGEGLAGLQRSSLRQPTSRRRKLQLLVFSHTDQLFINTFICTDCQHSHLLQRKALPVPSLA